MIPTQYIRLVSFEPILRTHYFEIIEMLKNNSIHIKLQPQSGLKNPCYIQSGKQDLERFSVNENKSFLFYEPEIESLTTI